MVVHNAGQVRALRSDFDRAGIRHRDGIHQMDLVGELVRDEQISGFRVDGHPNGAEHSAGNMTLCLKG